MAYKGISFDNIHSYDNLNLFLSGSNIPPAIPKTNYIELVGGDGSIDLTEALGEVKYNDRECEFIFTMNPSGGLTDADFEAKKTEVSNALNGKVFNKITLDKDSNYYYTGRATVSEFLSDKRLRQIVVTAKVKPYKYKQNETVRSFSLSTTSRTVTVTNGRKSVVPQITCTNANTYITFGGVSKTLSAGTHKVLEFQLKQGNNSFTVSGSGTLTFRYQEGDL